MSSRTDLPIIGKRILCFFYEFRKSVNRIRRRRLKDPERPALIRRTGYEMQHALKQLRGGLPKVVRDRFDVTFKDVIEAINGSDDLPSTPRRFKWPKFSEILKRAKTMLVEFEQVAKSSPNDYTLKPRTDDDAIDGIVRILAPREKHERRRLREEYANHPVSEYILEFADELSTAGFESNTPQRGAHWEDVCKEIRNFWPEIPPDAIEQAMNEAIYDKEFVRLEGSVDFTQWFRAPRLERPEAIFRLTPEGKWHAETQLGIPGTMVKALVSQASDATNSRQSKGNKANPKTSKKVPKRPPDEAWRAWNLLGLLGNQTRVAEELFGNKKKQYKVSRFINAVKVYLEAGGLALPLNGDQSKIEKTQSIDPHLLDMGKRQDTLTPRQRQQCDSNSSFESA